MPSNRKLVLMGMLVLAIVAVFALWAWAEDAAPAQPADTQEAQPAASEEQAPEQEAEPIVSSNGLELVEWYTTTGHELHVRIHDQGTVRGHRQGTVSFTMTPDSGASQSGRKRFNCSPNDNYDRDLVLLRYKPNQRDQWARVDVTFTDNKGTSDFWFDVYLN